jgi:hypothetical protein
LEPVLTIAAALGGKSPFVSPLDPAMREEATKSHKRFLQSRYPTGPEATATATAAGATVVTAGPASAAGEGATENCYSDHLALVNAYNQWHYISRRHGAVAARKFCQDRYLAANVMADMQALREHFRTYLRQTGFLGPSNSTSGGGPVAEEGLAVDASEYGETEGTETVDDDPVPVGARVSQAAEPLQGGVSRSETPQEGRLTGRALDNLVRCALCAGLYPQIARLGKFWEVAPAHKAPHQRGKGAGGAKMVETIKVLLPDRSEVSLHPSCLVSG